MTIIDLIFGLMLFCGVIAGAIGLTLICFVYYFGWCELGCKWHWGSKDGGRDSTVTIYGLEIKALFSVLFARFGQGSREALHTHAFNAVSWVLSGKLFEDVGDSLTSCSEWIVYLPSWKPIWTPRTRMHKVSGIYASNWVLTFRGPWVSTWRDVSAAGDLTLTHGRKQATRSPGLQRAQIRLLKNSLHDAESRAEHYREACLKTQLEVTQVLGKALGYPWYKDDQKNFPGATEADGVCVGEHTAESLAAEAADALANQWLEALVAQANARK